jgi:hypothetical protein
MPLTFISFVRTGICCYVQCSITAGNEGDTAAYDHLRCEEGFELTVTFDVRNNYGWAVLYCCLIYVREVRASGMIVAVIRCQLSVR